MGKKQKTKVKALFTIPLGPSIASFCTCSETRLNINNLTVLEHFGGICYANYFLQFHIMVQFNRSSFLLILLLHIFIEQCFTSDSFEVDKNGYIVYCPCMGKH